MTVVDMADSKEENFKTEGIMVAEEEEMINAVAEENLVKKDSNLSKTFTKAGIFASLFTLASNLHAHHKSIQWHHLKLGEAKD